MADTFKSWSDIATDLADNTGRAITPQALRNALNSFRAYGLLYATGGASAQSLSSTYGAVTAWTAADSNGVGTTANATAGSITVTSTGLYEVGFDASGLISDASKEYQFGVLKNAGTTPETGSKTVYLNSSNSAYTPVVHRTVLSLTAGDVLTLAVASNSGTPTFTLKEGTFLVKRVA